MAGSFHPRILGANVTWVSLASSEIVGKKQEGGIWDREREREGEKRERKRERVKGCRHKYGLEKSILNEWLKKLGPWGKTIPVCDINCPSCTAADQ